MLSLSQIEQKLKTMLHESRYIHSIGVKDTAVKLAEIYGADVYEAAVAGFVHDCAKNLKNFQLNYYIKKYNINLDEITLIQKELQHGPIGAYVAHEVFEIDNTDILNAIYYHTTGKPEMTLLEKIIYIADFIEPNRNFSGVEELRKLTIENLDKAVLKAMDNTIIYVIEKRGLIHIDTINARNYYTKKLREDANG